MIKLMHKIVDYIYQYLISKKLNLYKVFLRLILFGITLLGIGSFNLETKDFSFKYDNGVSVIEYFLGAFLICSGLIGILIKYIKDLKISSSKENYLYYISDKELDSKDSFNKNILPEEGRINLSKTERKFDTYSKEQVIENYNFDLKREIEPRSKNKNVENTYVAGIGSFPHLYLMGSFFGSAYDSNIQILDFDRQKHIWYIPRNIGNRLKYKVNFEDIEVKHKINILKYNGNNEVGIAISNSYSIEKNSILNQLVNDTLFLIIDGEIGINSANGLIEQDSLIEQLTNIIGELSNTKKKIHLFVAARASFCIRFGTNYMPKTYSTIVLHNYDSKNKERNWSIELNNRMIS